MSGYVAALHIFKTTVDEAMAWGLIIAIVTVLISPIILSNKLTKEEEEQLNQRRNE
jgi:H+/gluconate symporter-like permease